MSVDVPKRLRGLKPGGDVEDRRVKNAVGGRLFGDLAVDAPRVDRFEVRGRLGAGAMGVVYEAHDPQLDRVVLERHRGRALE